MKYFTVGPTQIYPKVLSAIKSALKEDIISISHRSSWFRELYSDICKNLRTLLNIPLENSIFFLSSGTEAMERIIQNTVYKCSFHFINGAFSKRFFETSVELNKKTFDIQSAPGLGFDFAKSAVPKESEIICLTHNETSTGVMLDMKQIYSLCARHTDKLIALDTVSSMPYSVIDFKKIDMVFFSVQKGFGLPAGLGILVVSPRAIEKSEYIGKKKITTGSYHSFTSLQKYADRYETPETPNVFGLYILNKVLIDMINKGIKTIRTNTEDKSNFLEKYLLSSEKFEYLVKSEKLRSKTVHVVKVSGGSSTLIKSLKKRGILVSSGYGIMKEDYIRIANFPAHSKKDIEDLTHCFSLLC